MDLQQEFQEDQEAELVNFLEGEQAVQELLVKVLQAEIQVLKANPMELLDQAVAEQQQQDQIIAALLEEMEAVVLQIILQDQVLLMLEAEVQEAHRLGLEDQAEAVMLEVIMVAWEVMDLPIKVVEAVELALTQMMVLIKEEEMVVQV